MSVNLEQTLGVIGAFGELLNAAGNAAANHSSDRIRAIACRTVDQLGSDWHAQMSGARAELATAIVTTVHALAAAPSSTARLPIAIALRNLVAAGRLSEAAPPRPANSMRQYWLEEN